jgi:hypothetical protein
LHRVNLDEVKIEHAKAMIYLPMSKRMLAGVSN